jgi:hypothetical protein
MKEGYWINYKNGKVFNIVEHETWLRRRGNAKKLGVPPNVIRAFSEFEPVRDRDKFLMFIMQHAPVMRVRGHGNYVSFEYASRDRSAPLEAIWDWAMDNAGPYTLLYIVNLVTKEKTQIYYQDFEIAMGDGGARAVMRAASVEKIVIIEKIAKELLVMAKRLTSDTTPRV